MLIAIPSKGRPNLVRSQGIIQEARVYVPENEVESYEQAGVNHVRAVPQMVRGITKTRNWILDHANDRWVVFIDDDVKRAGYVKLNRYKSKFRRLTGDQIIGEWVKLFDITEQLGYRIWGCSTEGSPRAVYPWNPIMFHSYITASCMGIINDGRTRFDESYPVKEDYELSLRCIVEDGGAVCARYFFWENSHWHDEGGCKDYRTRSMEKTMIRKLQRQFPGMVKWATNRKGDYCIRLYF
jgi:hypothetical protein